MTFIGLPSSDDHEDDAETDGVPENDHNLSAILSALLVISGTNLGRSLRQRAGSLRKKANPSEKKGEEMDRAYQRFFSFLGKKARPKNCRTTTNPPQARPRILSCQETLINKSKEATKRSLSTLPHRDSKQPEIEAARKTPPIPAVTQDVTIGNIPEEPNTGGII